MRENSNLELASKFPYNLKDIAIELVEARLRPSVSMHSAAIIVHLPSYFLEAFGSLVLAQLPHTGAPSAVNLWSGRFHIHLPAVSAGRGCGCARPARQTRAADCSPDLQVLPLRAAATARPISPLRRTRARLPNW